MGQGTVQERTLDFAVDVLDFTDDLDGRGRRIIAEQLLRAGTSIGANVREAQNAESPRDFLHKMKVAAKEAEETEYWLLLCRRSARLPEPGRLLDDLLHIKRLLSRIIASMKRRIKS